MKENQPDLFESPYRGGLPPHEPRADTSTSREAAISIHPGAGTMRRRVLDFIRQVGPVGVTDDELEYHLGLRHQTASARRRELELGGFICKTGRTRKTRSGRSANVYVALRVREFPPESPQ